MISVEETLERILGRVAPLGEEQVGLLEALGRVLAEAIVSPRDIPPWPNSSMDGYALRSADTTAARPERPVALRVAGRVAAGMVAERPLGPGEAYRILTGAPLPSGADAVIPQEEVILEGERVRVQRPVGGAECVRARGEDVRAGDTVLARGRVLGAAELGLLATVGRLQVPVVRRPVVGVLSTGDEVVDLGGALGPGQIPNSNTYALMAQVREAGGEPVNLGVARDDLADIERRLRWGLASDLLISSAGVSVGDHDFVKAALEALGAEQHVWLVNMRPGKPVTFATVPCADRAALPIFGLPGNPVSAMVTFELFVRPAIRRLGGYPDLGRPVVRARAAEPIPNPGARRGYLRVTLTRGADQRHEARLTGAQGSGILRSMVAADGLAVVEGHRTVRLHEDVDVIVLRGAS
jgi:molybdopterin molybdotransferase